MSAAPQLVPTVPIPARARPGAPRESGSQLASVTVLHAPSEIRPASPTVRLTRRGVVVLTIAVLALGAALIWLAKLSAPDAGAARPAPHSVTVAPGDTLWSIATRVAPDVDPVAEVAALQRRNHLTDVGLVPGQVLRVP
ncbi:MAG TPA: LysM peptidoglycan-binding domain-containing protein [Jatrophihabitans sp.]|jgi:nucleoid-associated protein YgaU|nr:LysM peptidoglycan-binding domain-containing protein [Jatrophihabitans sp.]